MTLETFGGILMAIGLVLFVYGYLKASARLDVEEGLHHARYDDPHRTPPDLLRVTEQEKREAFRIAAVLPIASELFDDGLWPLVRVRPVLYDWQDSGDFA